MAKLIHTMVRVSALEPAIQFYSTAFNFKEKHRLDFPTFTLVYLGNDQSEAELELTLNKDQATPYEHGTAYGHVAFSVEDLEACHQRLKKAGFNPADIKQLDINGVTQARFFFITDPDGYKIEVLERGGHFK